MEQFYEQVYHWFPDRTYDRVLIVGAGSGTDVGDRACSTAPATSTPSRSTRRSRRIGVRHHPDQPYEDPRVTRIENDGRAFLRGTNEQYDLVIFALPDSLTLVSTTANLRLESFLFTDRGVRERARPPHR